MSQVYPWDRGTNFAVEIGRKAARLMLEPHSIGYQKPINQPLVAVSIIQVMLLLNLLGNNLDHCPQIIPLVPNKSLTCTLV